MLKLYLFQLINPISIKDKDFLLSYLQLSEKKDLSRYKIASQFETSLVSKVFLKSILAKQLKIPTKEIEIAKKELGSPYIKRPTKSGIDISISHSDNCIALGMSDMGQIGIDIEKLNPIKLDGLHSVFTSEENKYIFSPPTHAIQLRRFYKIWTLKEAYSKSVKKGLFLIPKVTLIENNFVIKNNKKQDYSFITYATKDLAISFCIFKKIDLEFLRRQKIRKLNDISSLKL